MNPLKNFMLITTSNISWCIVVLLLYVVVHQSVCAYACACVYACACTCACAYAIAYSHKSIFIVING